MEKMKTITLLACLLSFLPVFASEKPIPSTDGRRSQVWLSGDSSLHKYSSTANNMKVSLVSATGASKMPFERWATVTIPVNEMRSGKNGLDKNMQKALKADEHPDIVFHPEKFEVVMSTINVAGTLEIAGTKKTVMLEAMVTQDGSLVHVQGKKDLLMTDYGIKPPKILLIKTTNEVTVHYDLWIDAAGELK